MSDSADMAASADSRALFADAVRATLRAWPALQIAVENGFGGAYGQEKADWLVDVVQQYFHDNPDLAQDEVEDFIGVLMDQEFHTLVDDGSLPQMCVQLMRMFSQWQQGALQQLSHSIHLLTQKQAPRAKVAAPPGQSDSDSDGPTQEMEMEIECASANTAHPPPPPPPHDDEDGWTLVGKRK